MFCILRIHTVINKPCFLLTDRQGWIVRLQWLKMSADINDFVTADPSSTEMILEADNSKLR